MNTSASLTFLSFTLSLKPYCHMHQIIINLESIPWTHASAKAAQYPHFVVSPKYSLKKGLFEVFYLYPEYDLDLSHKLVTFPIFQAPPT